MTSGSPQKAKQYFSEAATSDSPAGRQARVSLLRLDFPAYADQYIQVQIGLNREGFVMAKVFNQAPLDIKNLLLAIRYPDSSGNIQQTSRSLSTVIPSGQSYTAGLNLGPYTDVAVLNSIRIQITNGELIER